MSTDEYNSRQMVNLQADRIAELALKNMRYKENFSELMDIAVTMRGLILCNGIDQDASNHQLKAQCERLMTFISDKR